MEVDSNQQQILELAITRELEAYHFYMALSENVNSEQICGIFEELAGKVSDLLSSTHQWRMSLASTESTDKAASDDLTVTGYHVITGKKM